MAERLGLYTLNSVILGDCQEALEKIPDNSVDTIITDPPYGLGNDPDMMELLVYWLNDKDYNTGPGFMSKSWDIVPGPAIWRECYRVMKPGGCLMAFGGTRTCDLLSIAIRLAGFQRFDELVWLHGQGFGKGADVSKKLDAMVGAEREVVGETIVGSAYTRADKRNANQGFESGQILGTITAPATEAAKLFSGYRSQLKPAHEVILCFWKPREGSFASNALAHGVAGLWIDGCRIGTGGDLNPRDYDDSHRTAPKFSGVYNNGKEGQYRASPGAVPSGRYPANVLLSHHESCVRVGVKRVRGDKAKNERDAIKDEGCYGNGRVSGLGGYADPDGRETIPDYRCHPGCPVRMLDEQAGVRESGGKKNGRRYKNNNSSQTTGVNCYGNYDDTPHYCYGDTGSASRFFYCPKAPPREKWFYCQICDDCYPYAERDDHAHGQPKGQRKHQVAHPTVKPIAICNYALGVLEYLCRLTQTPTGGIVLDPFGGSGTTALAAIANGRNFLIVENDPVYHKIATKRIKQAMEKPRQLALLAGVEFIGSDDNE